MYNNIIFDFGRVLVEFDPYEMTAPYVQDPKDIQIVSQVVFDRLYWNRLDDGSISDDEVKKGIKSRLPERLWDDALNAYENWIYHLPFIGGMRELVTEFKEQGVKLYLLSNISIGFAEKYHTVCELKELLSNFDGLVFSGPIHMTKPNKEIFQHLLNKYSLNSEDCIFIDDSEINIQGAKRVGIQAYHFDGDVKKLRDYLLG